MKRLFDILFSLLAIVLLSPVFLLISLAVKWDSKGSVFYLQERIGKDRKAFKIFKFRSMYQDGDHKGLLTVGARDPRVTPMGHFLRKYKLDELPQMFNVFKGDMSFVGPRPEVQKYVDLYTVEQLAVLSVRPGITDPASIKYRNENELLGKADDPEEYYIRVVMQDKLKCNLEYIENQSFFNDIKIIWSTIRAVFT